MTRGGTCRRPQGDGVTGYRSQDDVESGFRQLKDPYVVGFSPMLHQAESKIRVHVFYCVLALALVLALAHLMRGQAHHGGLDLSAASYWPTSPGSKRPS